MISFEEIAKHNNRNSCWVVLHGVVYDMTKFLDEHPGGAAIILKQAGKDGTKAFDAIHPRDIVKMLPPEAVLGKADMSTAPAPSAEAETAPPSGPASAAAEKPPIDHMLNIFDFESLAQQSMQKPGWDYYCSGADDEKTLRENKETFDNIWLVPRVLRDVSSIDFATTMLGCSSSIPVYLTATAVAKLAHPDGELGIIRAAHAHGLVYMLPTLSSYAFDDMLDAIQPGQPFWMQLYVNRDRNMTAEHVRKAAKRGCRALCVTVDAPQLGRRERDMRNKLTKTEASIQKDAKDNVNRKEGIARAISSFIDPSLDWKDLAFLRGLCDETGGKMKLVLKGVQSGADALEGVARGADALILSNHGGRQVDTARPGIDVLPEVVATLRAAYGGEGRQLRGPNGAPVEVFVDGGIRRATDVFKCLAMGATGVGIGRPVLWSLAAYGQPGVEKVISLLKDEMTMLMRLMGAPRLADMRPEMCVYKGPNGGVPVQGRVVGLRDMVREQSAKL
mmetsp:Transcript_32073/g.63586  ORF Transcript_32073/g.63586 Transcript_32073/m.63586 type:complete len:504 (-) Transcript_32073:650-2161(-)